MHCFRYAGQSFEEYATLDSDYILVEGDKLYTSLKVQVYHCVKRVRIRNYSGLYFPTFELNTDQNNSEYKHFSRSVF